MNASSVMTSGKHVHQGTTHKYLKANKQRMVILPSPKGQMNRSAQDSGEKHLVDWKTLLTDSKISNYQKQLKVKEAAR